MHFVRRQTRAIYLPGISESRVVWFRLHHDLELEEL